MLFICLIIFKNIFFLLINIYYNFIKAAKQLNQLNRNGM